MRRRPTALLLGYGLVVAIVGVLLLVVSTQAKWAMLETRLESYESSVEVLKDGGPLLLGYAADVDVGGGNDAYRPLGVTDDQGSYVFVPLVAHVLGLDDPRAAMEILFLACVFVALLLYPLIFYELFGSLAAAAVAPLVLLAGTRVLYYQDVYWVPALAALALLPPLLLVDRRWPRASIPILLVALVLAGVASSFRSNAGLAIAVAGALVVLRRPWPLPRKALAVAALAIAYLSFGWGAMSALREHRDDWVGDPAFAKQAVSSHPVWHSAYIGLGYLPNGYDLRYRDEDAAATVELIEPGTKYVSAEYEAILRDRYFEVATGNPDFFASVTAQKVLVAIGNAAPLLVLLALLIPMALAARRREFLRWGLLAAPAVALAAIPPVFTVPFQVYETGLYGALGVCIVVLLAWLASAVEPRLRPRPALETVARLWRAAAGRGRTLAVILAAVAVVIFFARMPIDDRAMGWQESAPPGGESNVRLEER